jgi:HipA-like protein
VSELIALLNEREVGTVRQERGRISFEYVDSWRGAPDASPLSLSMPLAAAKHGHASIAPFLWGLLPDNEFILTQWGRRFQVSANNPFALIGHVGEDCAGAILRAPRTPGRFTASRPEHRGMADRSERGGSAARPSGGCQRVALTA